MIVIVFISIIIYLIATVIILNTLKGFTQGEKIKFMITSLLIVLVITFIICSITSSRINIERKDLISVTKNTAILIFAPVNSIILLPIVGKTISKFRNEELSDKELKGRIITIAVLLIIVMIVENNYIENFQLGLLKSAIQ